MKNSRSLKEIIGASALAVVLITALAGFAACTRDFPESSQLDDTGTTVEIVSPQDGATLPPGDITVVAQVTNFNIVDKLGQANIPGEGHLHFFLDMTPPTAQGKPAIPTGGDWAAVAGTTYTFKNMGEGTHTIAVELVNNDHTPLNPPEVYQISINVSSQGAIGGGFSGSDNTSPPANTGGSTYGY